MTPCSFAFKSAHSQTTSNHVKQFHIQCATYAYQLVIKCNYYLYIHISHLYCNLKNSWNIHMYIYIYILNIKHIYRTRRRREFPKIRNLYEKGVWSSSGSKVSWCQIQVNWKSNDLVVNRFEIQMIWLSIYVRFKWFWLSVDLNFKWGGCQLIWDSSDLFVNQFGIQTIWLSIDLGFKWVACQLIWDSNDLDVRWFEVQVIWLSNDVWFKWFCQTKLFCETSFKKDALKLKHEAFARDFLQKWSFEDQKRTFLQDFLQKWNFEDQKQSISARLPSKMKLWRSKTRHFCETSFQNDILTRHLTSEFQYVLAIFKWMLQKYCACHEKIEPRHTKSCNCHAKCSLQSNTSVTWNIATLPRILHRRLQT